MHTKSVPVTLLNTECRGDFSIIIVLPVSLFVKGWGWHENRISPAVLRN